MKPILVFCASLVYFCCITIILLALLKISSGIADNRDFVLMFGLILFTSAFFAFLVWYSSRRKKQAKDQSDSY